MQYLGTERYKEGRYGLQEVSYYQVGDMIEQRQLNWTRDGWLVTRYVGVTPADMILFTAMLVPLTQRESKSVRGHDDLWMKILRYYGHVVGHVDLDQIDSPDRRVVVKSTHNLPSHQAAQAWLPVEDEKE